jgi:arginine kinase
METKLEFVRHDKFGYLTFCPTNIGTGLRASVHVKVPKTAESGKLKEICEGLNLQPRGQLQFKLYIKSEINIFFK